MRGINANTGKALSGVEHLRQSVRDILFTPIGSRVMRRTYGSRLLSLVDAPMNRKTLLDVYASTVEALNTWEPRLKVDTVRATKVEPGVIELTITGKYLGDAVEIVVGQPPVITSALTAAGETYNAFSYQITASGSPTSFYVVGGLPAGLTLNATTGLISGTPAAVADSVITVGAVNPYGTGEARVALSVALGFTTETQGWAARVTAAGGTYTTDDLIALDALVRAYKTAGFTDANSRINAFCGGDLIAARVPVFRAGGPDVDAMPVLGPSYSRATGITPGGGHLRLGVQANTIGADDSFSYGVYSRSGSLINGGTEIGTNDASSNVMNFSVNGSASNSYAASFYTNWAAAPRGGVAASGSDGLGMLLASVVPSDVPRLYRRGTEMTAAGTGRNQSRPANEISVFGRYQTNGSISGLVARPLGGYHVGPGITAGQAADLSTAWQTYATAMGRAV
ncbi:MAG: hypothetical protein RLZZ127_1388 [Planctomycetota bacterium]|jgi:phage baseplate assembly protein W